MNLSNINAIVAVPFKDHDGTLKTKFITYHSVHGIPKFIRFLNTKYPSWTFFTAFDKATNQKQIIRAGEKATQYWASL